MKVLFFLLSVIFSCSFCFSLCGRNSSVEVRSGPTGSFVARNVSDVYSGTWTAGGKRGNFSAEDTVDVDEGPVQFEINVTVVNREVAGVNDIVFVEGFMAIGKTMSARPHHIEGVYCTVTGTMFAVVYPYGKLPKPEEFERKTGKDPIPGPSIIPIPSKTAPPSKPVPSPSPTQAPPSSPAATRSPNNPNPAASPIHSPSSSPQASPLHASPATVVSRRLLSADAARDLAALAQGQRDPLVELVLAAKNAVYAENSPSFGYPKVAEAVLKDTTNSILPGPCYYKMYARAWIVPRNVDEFFAVENNTAEGAPQKKWRYRVPDFSDVDDYSVSYTKHPMSRPPGTLNMTAIMTSADCNEALTVEVVGEEMDEAYRKLGNYINIIVFVSLIQIYALMGQIKTLSTPAAASKVSIYSITMMALIDAYLCLGHLGFGVLYPLAFNGILMAVLLKFIVFALFEMRIIVMVWRSQSAHAEHENLYFVFLFGRFYVILALGFFLIYLLKAYIGLIVIMMYMFWVPQIVRNVISNVKKPIQPKFVLIMSTTRLVLPLYLTLCPSNMLHFSAPLFGSALFVAMVSQTVLLLGQYYLGPRFFLPQRCLPASYNYNRLPLRESSDGGDQDCVICMHPITQAQVDSGDQMVTPCDHCFHKECLEQWMEIKLICPTCRADIPPT